MTVIREIPQIDIGPLVSCGASTANLARVVREIGETCRDIGFFYVLNHGIDEEHRQNLLLQTKRFFDLDLESKMRLSLRESGQFRGYVPLCEEITAGRPDWHECVDLQPKATRDLQAADSGRHPLDDHEQWPDGLPEFRLAAMRSWDDLMNLGAKLIGGVAMSLGLRADFFEPCMGPGVSSLRLSHYPPSAGAELTAADDDLGMGAHYDLGFLTIISQDDVGGLEICSSDGGDWIPAPYRQDALLVNIGLTIQRWTNDLYPAIWHRVSLSRRGHRYSTLLSLDPRADAVIAPLDVCCSADRPPRYEPRVFGELMNEVFTKAYRSQSAEAPSSHASAPEG